MTLLWIHRTFCRARPSPLSLHCIYMPRSSDFRPCVGFNGHGKRPAWPRQGGGGGGGGGTPYIYRVSHDNEGQFFAPHPMQMPMNSFCTTCCILTPLGSPISSILTLMISIDSNQVLAWGIYVILLSLPKFNLHPLELAAILLCVGGGGGVRCTITFTSLSTFAIKRIL